jgi:hypothetical protein
MRDGQTIKEEQLFVLGAARRPLSMAHVVEKFKTCASASGLAGTKAARVINMVESMEQLEDISQLLRQLRLP